MKKKLKKKIWIISSIILASYITAIILNPTAWTALLPIIIPTGILTIGMPAYSITKYAKDSLEKDTNKLIINNNETEKNQHTNSLERTSTNNKVNSNIQINYESNINQEEKVKVKKKGTI